MQLDATFRPVVQHQDSLGVLLDRTGLAEIGRNRPFVRSLLAKENRTLTRCG